MPTSPRELTGGTGWYQPTALFSNLRADEGHRPLREREDFTAHRGTAEYFRGPLHTRKAQRAFYGMILLFFKYRSSSENTQPQYFWM